MSGYEGYESSYSIRSSGFYCEDGEVLHSWKGFISTGDSYNPKDCDETNTIFKGDYYCNAGYKYHINASLVILGEIYMCDEDIGEVTSGDYYCKNGDVYHIRQGLIKRNLYQSDCAKMLKSYSI